MNKDDQFQDLIEEIEQHWKLAGVATADDMSYNQAWEVYEVRMSDGWIGRVCRLCLGDIPLEDIEDYYRVSSRHCEVHDE